MILAIREKYDNKLNMIEKEMANVQKYLQYDQEYDTSLVPERLEHSKLKNPRGQNTSTYPKHM